MTNVLWLAIFSAMLAVGQLLFKQAGLGMRGLPLLDGFLAVVRTPAFYAALALYGVATMVWIWILSRVPLSLAYPWVALAMAVVPVLASLVFHERVGPAYWVGIVFVAFGVLLTQYGSGAP